MRTPILCLFCAALAAQNAAVNPPGLCSLEGKVVSDATGAPIADAKLKLLPTVSPAVAPESNRARTPSARSARDT